jgi:capsular polysaccharide biosynthesis protein
MDAGNLEWEINLLRLAKEIGRKWWILAIAVFAGLGAGYVLSKVMTKKYSSKVVFVTEQSKSIEQTLPSLGLLTGGLGLGGLTSEPPFISHFEDFIKTRSFLGSLKEKVATDSTRELLLKYYGAEVMDTGTAFYGVAGSLLKGTRKDGLIKLEAITKDPALSLGLAKAAFVTFQTKLNQVRMQSVMENLDFIQKLVARNLQDYEQKSGELRIFLERNMDASSPSLQQTKQRLMLSVKLAEEKYILSIKEEETLKIKRDKTENNIVMIEEPYFSVFPVSPSAPLNLALGGFLGCALSIFFVMMYKRKTWLVRVPVK